MKDELVYLSATEWSELTDENILSVGNKLSVSNKLVALVSYKLQDISYKLLVTSCYFPIVS